MPKALDITGQKFGKLTAIKRGPSKNNKTYWYCQCDCGNPELKLVQTTPSNKRFDKKLWLYS